MVVEKFKCNGDSSGVSMKTFTWVVSACIAAAGLALSLAVNVLLRDREVEKRMTGSEARIRAIEETRFTHAHGAELKGQILSLELKMEKRLSRVETILERIEKKVDDK